MQVQQPNRSAEIGAVVQACPYFGFMDRAFMNIVKDSSIDYLIWFAPYKHCDVFTDEMKPIVFPEAVIIDVHDFNIDLIDYDVTKMESVEL